MKDAKSIREKELKAAQSEMDRLKKKAEDSRSTWKKHEQDYESGNLEIEELRAGIESCQKQIQAINDLITNLTKEVEELTQSLEEAKASASFLFFCRQWFYLILRKHFYL